MRGIFISYRREDSSAYAGRLHDALVSCFGSESVFFDIDSVGFGEDYREVIKRTWSSCRVVLVVIGKDWATVRDKSGRLRLENANDVLRTEIASALQNGLFVVPVLVGGAEMPEADALPPDIREIVFRNGIDLSDKRFHQDLSLLIDSISKVLGTISPGSVRSAVEREMPENHAAAATTASAESTRSPSSPRTNRKVSSVAKPAAAGRFLFPVLGIILGETTVGQVEDSGAGSRSTAISPETRKPYPQIEVGDVTFGYNQSDVIDSMHLVHGEEVPEGWLDLGFDWSKSYDQWISWLNGLSYSIEVDRAPSVKDWKGYKSLDASLYARVKTPHAHRIWLTFAASTGTTTQAPDTLLSMYFTPK